MNRRRALLSYEMRKMKWVLLIAVLGSLLFVLHLYGRVSNGGEVLLWHDFGSGYFGSCFSNELLNLLHDYHIYIWLLFAVIVTVQFQDFHNKKTEEYMSSLPFTARERFLTKSLIGYAVIAVSWILLSAGTLIVRQNVITQYHKQSLLFPFTSKCLPMRRSGIRCAPGIIWIGDACRICTVFTDPSGRKQKCGCLCDHTGHYDGAVGAALCCF